MKVVFLKTLVSNLLLFIAVTMFSAGGILPKTYNSVHARFS